MLDLNQSAMSTVDLLDLDDGVLVDVFGRLDPKPDLFGIMLVCKVSEPLCTQVQRRRFSATPASVPLSTSALYL